MGTDFLVPKNLAESTLASGIDDDDTSLTVATGEGAKFPSTYPFHITIEDEILRCTNRSADVLTVLRAQEGTAAAAHSSGKEVRLNITAKALSDLNEAVNDLEDLSGWELLDDYTFTSPGTTHTLSGLDGDSDEVYMIKTMIVAGASGSCWLRPNSDSGDGKYDHQYLRVQYLSSCCLF